MTDGGRKAPAGVHVRCLGHLPHFLPAPSSTGSQHHSPCCHLPPPSLQVPGLHTLLEKGLGAVHPDGSRTLSDLSPG